MRRPGAAAGWAAAAFCVLSIAFYVQFRLFARNADDTSNFLAGMDLLSGNWRLAGWWLPPDSFWGTELLLLGLVGHLMDGDPRALIVAPSLLWAGVVAGAALLAVRGLAEARGRAVLTVFTLLGLLIFDHDSFAEQFTHAPIHIATILATLALIALADRIAGSAGPRPRGALLAFGLLTAWITASDPMVFMTAVLPVAATLLFTFGNRVHHRWTLLGVLAVAALLGRLAIAVNTATGGFQQPVPTSLAFVRFDDIGSSVSHAIFAMLDLLGAMFFGMSALDGIPRMLRVVLLTVLAVHVARFAAALIRWVVEASRPSLLSGLSFLDRLLTFGVVSCVGLTAASAYLIDNQGTRYLMPGAVLAAVLLARILPESPRLRGVWAAACIASIISVLAYAIDTPRPPTVFATRHEVLLQRLQGLGIAQGLGPYWSSSPMTVASGGAITVRALRRTPEGELVPYLWLADARWFEPAFPPPRPFFVVVDRAAPGPIDTTEDSVLVTFGPPAEVTEAGDYAIFVYR